MSIFASYLCLRGETNKMCAQAGDLLRIDHFLKVNYLSVLLADNIT